jgi:hypothetical protein
MKDKITAAISKVLESTQFAPEDEFVALKQ